MEETTASFWRRAIAGFIDFGTAFTIAIVGGVVWLYSEVGACDCSTDASIQEYVFAMSLQARSVAPSVVLLPLIGYALLSWSPVMGGRSLGMRALGLRVVRS